MKMRTYQQTTIIQSNDVQLSMDRLSLGREILHHYHRTAFGGLGAGGIFLERDSLMAYSDVSILAGQVVVRSYGR